MKLGIIGLPQTGKKTLFELLTGSAPSPADAQKGSAGVADIRDSRFLALSRMYNPKKETPARIDMQLLPKLDPGTARDFRDVADADALCHVVRVFQDDSIYHASGSVDPARDIETVNGELFLNDLVFIEKRLDRIEKDRKKKEDKRLQDEAELLNRFRTHLEADLPLRTLTITDEEKKLISGYPFLTRKKMLVVLNTGDDTSKNAGLMESLSLKFTTMEIDIMQVPAKLELEIAMLDSEEERVEFMKDAGITVSALEQLSMLAMTSLGLMSYFTVGKDEVRQWLVRRNATAPEAAGAIHSDIQRGFIRAEVIKYADLMSLKSEDEVKKAGKLYVMGKDYIVEDGDIINFRFNV